MKFNLDFVKNMQFEIDFGGKKFSCDQPSDNGGDGEFVSPVPYFVASIAMCAATYAGFFYKKSNISMNGFKIDGDYEAEYTKNARIKSVTLKIYSPNVDEKSRKRYEAYVNNCLVVNTVKNSMEVIKEFIYI